MNIYGNDFKEAFNFISKLIKNDSYKECVLNNKIFNEIDNFIRIDFFQFLKKEGSVNNIGLVQEFIDEFYKFCTFAVFNGLYGKSIVGIGGDLNTGKSSFLNCVFNKKLLPSKLTATTLVSTYIIHSEELKIHALNMFNNIIDLTEEEMKSISYEFEENYSTNVKDILKAIFIRIPEQEYCNLAFLDIPGYRKSNNDQHIFNKNKNLTMERLKSCQYVLWFIDCDCGTLKEKDMDILESLKKDIPILVLISKADKKDSLNTEKIKFQVKKLLNARGINVLDVLTFSSRKPDMYSMNGVRKYLEQWNVENNKTIIERNFQSIFNKIENYLYHNLREEKVKLKEVNSILMTMECNGKKDINKVQQIEQQFRYNIENIKLRTKELKELNCKFFSMLKKAGRIANISVCEDFWGYKENANIIDHIRKYKNENNIDNKGYATLIGNVLQNLNTDDFKNNLVKIINKETYKEIINRELCCINKNITKDYKDIIKNKLEKASYIGLNVEDKENISKLINKKIKYLTSKNIKWITAK